MEITEESGRYEKISACVDDDKFEKNSEFFESIAIYDKEIPAFVETELERLYESVYTSLERFKIYADMDGAGTYVARQAGAVTAVFIFRRDGARIRVLNEQIEIKEEEISLFAKTIFSRFQTVSVISFYAIDTKISSLSFPFQQFNSLEDIVLSLPETQVKYLDSLGSKMRHTIRNFTKKIEKKFSSFHFETYSKEAVPEEHIREIVNLSRKRMAVKDQASYVSEDETIRIIRLVKKYGFVGVVLINGRVCGGLICYCVGTTYFMQIIAHDPLYDEFILGTICTYLTVCNCIMRGGRECRFMGGGHVHKSRFLAVPLVFDNVVIYRSKINLILNCGIAGKIKAKIIFLKMRSWLIRAERKPGLGGLLAIKILTVWRNFKRAKFANVTCMKK